MTREDFLAWAESQDVRHEFDGVQPVAMVGTTANHNRIALNIHAALRSRLRGGRCEAFCMEFGLATAGSAVRYPDNLVTCGPNPGDARLASNVVVVFEVVSPTSGRMDRIVRVREYRAVAFIRRYAIVERISVGLTVLQRSGADQPWIASTLTSGDTLAPPELGVEVLIDELYEDVTFVAGEAGD